MQSIRLTLLILGPLVASIFITHDLRAQNGSYAGNPIHAWQYPAWRFNPNTGSAHHHAWSPNNRRLPAAPRWQRPQASRGTLYSAPYYAITTPWATPNLRSNRYPTLPAPSTRKPFSSVRPAPSAMERYWPMLYEAREDPKTGLIIWSLP